MLTVSLSTFRSQQSELLATAQREPVAITSRGKIRRAVIVSPDFFDKAMDAIRLHPDHETFFSDDVAYEGNADDTNLAQARELNAMPEYAEELAQMQRIVGRAEYEITHIDMIQGLTDSADRLLNDWLLWLLHVEGGKIVGALAYREQLDSINIERLGVLPHFQRRGIASSLLKRAMAEAQAITASPIRENYPARALLESQGFKPLHDRKYCETVWVREYELRHQPTTLTTPGQSS